MFISIKKYTLTTVIILGLGWSSVANADVTCVPIGQGQTWCYDTRNGVDITSQDLGNGERYIYDNSKNKDAAKRSYPLMGGCGITGICPRGRR